MSDTIQLAYANFSMHADDLVNIHPVKIFLIFAFGMIGGGIVYITSPLVDKYPKDALNFLIMLSCMLLGGIVLTFLYFFIDYNFNSVELDHISNLSGASMHNQSDEKNEEKNIRQYSAPLPIHGAHTPDSRYNNSDELLRETLRLSSQAQQPQENLLGLAPQPFHPVNSQITDNRPVPQQSPHLSDKSDHSSNKSRKSVSLEEQKQEEVTSNNILQVPLNNSASVNSNYSFVTSEKSSDVRVTNSLKELNLVSQKAREEARKLKGYSSDSDYDVLVETTLTKK